MKVARLPQRPSDLLEMRKDGYSARERLDLDLGFAAFDDRFAQYAAETVMAPLPQRNKRERPKVPVPAHDLADLRRVLGIDPDDQETTALALGDPWAAFDLEDDDFDLAPHGEGED